MSRWLLAVALLALHAGAQQRIRGVVLDWSGKPVADVGVEHWPNVAGARTRELQPHVVATTARDGTFEATLAIHRGQLICTHADWGTLVPCRLGGPVDRAYVVVVAPRTTVRGRVVDERGRAVVDATVELRMSDEARAELPETIEDPPEVLATAKSDGTGSFAIDELPAPPGSTVRAFMNAFQPFIGAAAPELEIVLRDPAGLRVVEGVVLAPDGKPAPGASVVIGSGDSCSSGSDGHFRLTCSPVPALAGPLVARYLDFQPVVRREIVFAEPDRHVSWNELRFASRARKISGYVLDASGVPVRYGFVRVADPTPIAGVELIGSRVIERGHVELSTGVFEIGGLLDRAYVLDVITLRPFAQFRSLPIRAGTMDVELRMPADALACRIEGRLRAPDGTPLFGAHVSVATRAPDGTIAWELPNEWHELDRFFPQTWTDADGRFTLREVSCKLAVVVVTGKELAPRALDAAKLDTTKPVELVVPRVARLRLEGLDDSLSWVAFELLDASGLPAPQKWGDWPSRQSTDALGVTAGVSGELAVAEGTYHLTVRAGKQTLIDAREVELVAGETLVVTPERGRAGRSRARTTGASCGR